MSDIDSLFGSFRPSPFRAPDRNQVPQQLFGAGDGNIQPVGFIEDGVVGFAAFASTIRPPQLVSGANPALPDADYPVDSFIYNTTSHKLWKNVADVWVEVVNTTDLSGQITSTQITDGAVSTPKLATDSVTADKILANTITAAEIAANTITAGEIAAGAIGADEIAAGAVVADKLSVGTRSQHGSMAPNYSFEDESGAQPLRWAVSTISGAGTTALRSTTQHKSGVASLRFGADSGAGNYVAYMSDPIPVAPGDRLYVEGWYRFSSTATSGAYLRVHALDESGTSFGSSDIVSNVGGTADVWNAARGYVTMGTGAAYAAIEIWLFQPNVGTFLYWDDIIFQKMAGGVINSASEVTIDAAGITVTNGAVTVTNAGSTVIIDGTSNMFKIDATGTLTQAFPAAGNNSVNTVTLTALGNGYTTPPTCLFYITENNASVAQDRENGSATRYPTNGASVSWTATGLCDVTAGEVRVMLWARSLAVGPGTTAALRYYVLVEAGI